VQVGALDVRAWAYNPGSSEIFSIRLADGFLTSPTQFLSRISQAGKSVQNRSVGKPISGDPPTKEIPLHLAFYDARPDANAIVHLHSTYATALSCLSDVDPKDAIPAITPYVVMRVGRVRWSPIAVRAPAKYENFCKQLARDHAAVLIANHGPVVSAPTLESAVFAAEELEETAKLVVITRGQKINLLTSQQVAELNSTFKLR